MVPDPQVLPLVPDCVAGGDVLVGGKVSLALGWGAKEAEAQSVGCVTPGAPAPGVSRPGRTRTEEGMCYLGSCKALTDLFSAKDRAWKTFCSSRVF